MSKNLHIVGTRECMVVKTGILFTDNKPVEIYQTPTRITNKILASDNPLQAYFDYVLENSLDEVEFVYAVDDIFEENEPIGTKICNYGKEHIMEIQRVIDDMISQGYEIHYELM
jgi:hypothetical protein